MEREIDAQRKEEYKNNESNCLIRVRNISEVSNSKEGWFPSNLGIDLHFPSSNSNSEEEQWSYFQSVETIASKC